MESLKAVQSFNSAVTLIASGQCLASSINTRRRPCRHVYERRLESLVWAEARSAMRNRERRASLTVWLSGKERAISGIKPHDVRALSHPHRVFAALQSSGEVFKGILRAEFIRVISLFHRLSALPW